MNKHERPHARPGNPLHTPRCCILSIGACLFDLASGEIGADTVKWWLKQDDAARAAIADNKKTVKLSSALFDFREFVPRHKAATFWSNGATFDLVIIRNALDRHNHMVSWQYWQERDTRTLVDAVHRITGTNTSKTTPFEGIKHDALADAIHHQARYISAAYHLLSGATA